MTKETYILGEVAATQYETEGKRVLEIETTKYNGQIITRASVHVQRKSQSGFDVRTFEICGDYSKTLKHETVKPITQKKLLAAHEALKDQFPAILEEAKAFYANHHATA